MALLILPLRGNYQMTIEKKLGSFFFNCGIKNGFGLGISIDRYSISIEFVMFWIGLELPLRGKK